QFVRYTISETIPAVAEISSAVEYFTMEKRIADRARASGNPIARRTCDATTPPTMQAEPLDAQTPPRSRAMSIVSESSAGRLMFRVFANRRGVSPFRTTGEICAEISCQR